MDKNILLHYSGETKSDKVVYNDVVLVYARPRGPMDKASDFESEDCGFDPHRGQFFIIPWKHVTGTIQWLR